MTKKYKIYKRTAYCDSGVDVSFGTEEDLKYWKEQEEEWIEQDFGVGDDTIEELKITSTDPNIGEILSVINDNI